MFKKKVPKEFSIEFLTTCYEGGTVEELDEIYQKAQDAGLVHEIWES
jgi:hypothetical protein